MRRGDKDALYFLRFLRCRVQRLAKERELLRPLPSLRPEIGIKVISRKVDKLSCIRFGSARYSVPCRLISGPQVEPVKLSV